MGYLITKIILIILISFKKTTAFLLRDEFTATDNITGTHVRFRPEFTRDTATGNIKVNFTDGVKFQKATGFVRA